MGSQKGIGFEILVMLTAVAELITIGVLSGLVGAPGTTTWTSNMLSLFCGLFALAVATQIGVLIAVRRWRRERPESGLRGERVIRSRILGILGGVVTIIGAFLPWATYSSGTPIYSFLFPGLPVLVFGLAGLAFVAIPVKDSAKLAAGCGVVAFLLNLAAFGMVATSASNLSTGYGVYVGILGSVVLIGGSAVAYMEMNKASPQAPRQTPG